MLPKYLIIILLGFIIYSLFSGLFFLIKDQGKTNRVLKALTYRISISFGLIIFLIIGFISGFFNLHTL